MDVINRIGLLPPTTKLLPLNFAAPTAFNTRFGTIMPGNESTAIFGSNHQHQLLGMEHE